jgi:hypothetical protein
MLGFEVAQSTVSKYISRGGKPPSQTRKTFLRIHADAIAAIDICVVPTLTWARGRPAWKARNLAPLWPRQTSLG